MVSAHGGTIMETSTRNYSRYTVEEKFQFIEEFYNSHISLTQYCKNKSLNKSSFYKWIKIYEESLISKPEETQPRGSFINITNEVISKMPPAQVSTPAPQPSTHILASSGVIQASSSIIDSPSPEAVLQKDEIVLSIGKIRIKCNFSILDKVLEKLQ